MTFESSTLSAIYNSLKVLKEYDLLDNKFITFDTLMELVWLALETRKEPGGDNSEKDSCFTKIITNILSSKTLKNSKVQQNIVNSTSNLQDKLFQVRFSFTYLCLWFIKYNFLL